MEVGIDEGVKLPRLQLPKVARTDGGDAARKVFEEMPEQILVEISRTIDMISDSGTRSTSVLGEKPEDVAGVVTPRDLKKIVADEGSEEDKTESGEGESEYEDELSKDGGDSALCASTLA
ncbi:hypothetical protein U1Q18_040334 [Sarracenia purpurea var. burkii]